MHLVLHIALVLLATAAPAAAAPVERDTPRTAAVGFLQAARDGDYARAATYLDLRRLPPAQREERGPELARRLKWILDRTLWVEPEALSDDPDGHRDDDLAPRLDRVGTITTSRGPVDVLLERGVADGGWQIAASTVAHIPALYAEFGVGPLADLLPAPLLDVHVLEIALWQWFGLVLIVLAALAIAWIGARVLIRGLRPLAARLGPSVEAELLAGETGPLRLAIGLGVFAAGVLALRLALPALGFFLAVERGLAVVTLAWFGMRGIELAMAAANRRLALQGRRDATAVMAVGRKALKVGMFVIAMLALLQNLGVNVTGLLAGLGIGGLAVALAAQRTVENLFGGISLLVDQPVRVGDFCRFGDRIGTVEEIGLRSTRVRTLDRTVVSVPNAEFATLQLENFAVRDRIWLGATLGLRYETTPEQLRYVLVEVRKMLYAHPRVHPDPARIRFVGFGASSLDLEIFAYVLTADFGEFLGIREDLYLRIMDIVAAAGTGFAFPSTTTYLARDAGLDASRTQAAEAAVRAWRERRELPLPDFTPEAIASLRGTIAYPPPGAPGS
jgi:MscS family membrane protein